MKRVFFAVCFIISAVIVNAQVKKGTIIYERKIDVHRHMKDEQMKAMVPQFQTSKHELIFSDSISVYKSIEEEDAPDPFDNGGGARVMIRIGGPGENAIMYRNFTNLKFLEQTELGDKTYIIDDTIKTQPWKLADETKTILGHVCKKATGKSPRGSDVVAWYAEDIPSPVGPEMFAGLPGAILLLDVSNGEMVFTATEIQKDADSKALIEPSKGKHLTRADFQKKLDELFGPASPDGRRMITRDN